MCNSLLIFVLCSTKQVIQEFFTEDIYTEETVPIKMHYLEDHTLQWANANYVGFGLLGEHAAAELIPTKLIRLGLVFAPIRDCVKNLECILKEHLLSTESQLLAAIPPLAKRIKNTKLRSPAQPQ